MTISPRARRITTTIGAVCFAIAMGLVGIGAGIYFAQRPPVIVMSLQERDGVAVRGSWLDLDVTLVRNRICNPKVDRWLWQMRDGVKYWVSLPNVPSPPVSLNHPEHYIIAVPVPGTVKAGAWHYTTRTRDGCPSQFSLRAETVRDSQDVPVQILDPTVDHPAQLVAPPGPVTIVPLK